MNVKAVKCLKRSFHLNGLKHSVKISYYGEDVMENVNKCNSDMTANAIKKQTDLKRSNCLSTSTRQVSSYFVQSDDSTNVYI